MFPESCAFCVGTSCLRHSSCWEKEEQVVSQHGGRSVRPSLCWIREPDERKTLRRNDWHWYWQPAGIKEEFSSVWNHRIIEWFGLEGTLKIIWFQPPWAGTSSTRPGCSELHPAWSWTLPGRGYPQLLWATWDSVSPRSWWRISS